MGHLFFSGICSFILPLDHLLYHLGADLRGMDACGPKSREIPLLQTPPTTHLEPDSPTVKGDLVVRPGEGKSQGWAHV